MADGSLSSSALETLARLTRQYELPFVADPSSVRLAQKLQPHLADLALVVPNEIEAAVMAGREFGGHSPEASLESALHLRQAGVETAIVTMSDFGLVYATSGETGHIPARYSQVVDSTGTGDAVTAAIMFGLTNNLPAVEAIRLGAAAASLTLQSSDTVVPNLSLDMLYDHLIA
jgi:pseudouridine kinase